VTTLVDTDRLPVDLVRALLASAGDVGRGTQDVLAETPVSRVSSSSRRFRAEYGMTPGERRRAAAGGRPGGRPATTGGQP
jgi:hypothetical protein